MKKNILIFTGIIALLLISILGYGRHVNIHSPANNTWHATRSPPLVFDISAGNSSYMCNLYSNDTGVYQAHAGNYWVANGTNLTIFDANFNEGTTIIYAVICNDSMSSDNETINIDVTDPVVTIANYSDNYYDDDMSMTLGVNASDTNNNVCELFIDSVSNRSIAYTSNLDVAFEHNASVNGSSFKYYFTCNDSANNRASTTERTVYVGAKPTITINSPSNNSYASDTNVDINITIDGNSDTYVCRVYSNDTNGTWLQDGGTIIVNNNTQTTLERVFAEAAVFYGVTCFETGSRYPYVFNAPGNRTLRVDTTTPVVTINSPEDGYHSMNDSSTDGVHFVINVTVDDAYPDACSLYINGTLNMTNNTITRNLPFIMLVNVSEADWEWNLGCNDSAGHIYNTTSRVVTIDNTMPAMSDIFNYSVQSEDTNTGFTFEFHTNEETNYTVHYGTSAAASNWTAIGSSFATNHTPTIVFNKAYSTTFYINVTACDQAGNCNNTIPQVSLTSPVGLPTGWSLWTVYDNSINLSNIYSDSGADYVYYWNKTGQSWMYYTSAATSYGNYNLTRRDGDVVFLYENTEGTWFRNVTGADSHDYEYNITTGWNWIGLYHDYTIGNLTCVNFVNSSGGNLTEDNFAFHFDYFGFYNNSGQKYINKLYSWTGHNTTPIGTIKNYLDTMYLYADYNVSVNMTEPGKGGIYGNWSD